MAQSNERLRNQSLMHSGSWLTAQGPWLKAHGQEKGVRGDLDLGAASIFLCHEL